MNPRDLPANLDLVLLGGDSRAAAAIATRFPAARMRLVTRRAGPGHRQRLDDYCAVPEAYSLTGATIVNCVGTDSGRAEVLDKLNRQVPLAWARAARDQGARAFIHLSSFSVYARQDLVGLDSALAPVSPYGRSKLAAERDLARLAGAGLAISLLRVPILVSPPEVAGSRDKLAALVALLRLTRLRPAPSPPIKRAMLSYQGLAAAVGTLLQSPQDVACAADPEPFSFELIAALAREQRVGMLTVPVPRPAAGLVARMSPGIHERLFTSMALAAADNILAQRSDFLRLREIIAMHLARR